MPPQLRSLYLLDTVAACYLHFQINYNSFQPQFRIFSLPVRYTIQIGNLHAGIMFRHILLYLIICCLSLCRCYIHIIKFNRDINIIIRLLFQLGRKNYRLNVSAKLKHIPTELRKYRQYLYSTNTARASLFPHNQIQVYKQPHSLDA